jgi:aminoglycoside phosphotransferase (APT) family kinase protein
MSTYSAKELASLKECFPPQRNEHPSKVNLGEDARAKVQTTIEQAFSLSVRNVELLSQNNKSSVFAARTDKKPVIVKISAKNAQETSLLYEFTVLQRIQADSLPIHVPFPLGYHEEERHAWLLQERIAGERVSDLFSSPTRGASAHHKTLFRIGQELFKLHARAVTTHSPSRFLDYALTAAKHNLDCALYDPEEFLGIDPPQSIYEFLCEHRPKDLKACLLHGDYRPKNILLQTNDQFSLIDWEHSFIGDPYYDLAVFAYYCKTKAALDSFLEGYGLSQVDRGKLVYFDLLSKFLNV